MNKNLKNVRRSSIDVNKREFLIIANQVKNAKDIEECSNIIVSAIKSSELDYNKITTLCAMYCNKCIGIFLENLEKDIKDEMVPSIIEKIGEDVYLLCDKTIENVKEIFTLKEDGEQAIKYLRELVKYIIKSFSYNNGYWEREEYIYDRMHLLAKDEFAKKYNIEIPYLYILAWSAISFFGRRKGHSGLEYDKKNTCNCVRRLGSTMIQILLGESVCDGIIYIPKIKGKEHPDERIEVKFEGLLPYIKNVENRTKDYIVYKSFKDKIVSKEVLLRIPMLPIEVTEGTVEEIKIFLDLVKEQNLKDALNKELLETNEKLQQAIKEKNAIVQEFSHTYGNMKATGLYEIAQTLINTDNPEHKKLGRRLLLEYGNKQDLTKDVYMMKLRFENNFTELQQLLRYSKKGNEDGEQYTDIYGIINSALKRCLMRVFYDGGDLDASIIRKQLKTFISSLNNLRDSFEEKVIFNDSDCMRWFQGNVHKIDVVISDEWKKIYLSKNSYGEVFLTSIFSELIINLFKYADKSKPIYLQLSTSKELDNYLQIVQKNVPLKNTISISGVGLSSKSEILKLINMEEDEDDKNYMQIINTTDEFLIKIMLKANLFV